MRHFVLLCFIVLYYIKQRKLILGRVSFLEIKFIHDKISQFQMYWTLRFDKCRTASRTAAAQSLLLPGRCPCALLQSLPTVPWPRPLATFDWLLITMVLLFSRISHE